MTFLLHRHTRFGARESLSSKRVAGSREPCSIMSFSLFASGAKPPRVAGLLRGGYFQRAHFACAPFSISLKSAATSGFIAAFARVVLTRVAVCILRPRAFFVQASGGFSRAAFSSRFFPALRAPSPLTLCATPARVPITPETRSSGLLFSGAELNRGIGHFEAAILSGITLSGQ